MSPSITYASVISRETVGIALTMEELNNMSINNADTMNGYINAPCGEKLYTILGPEFVPDEGKMKIIVRNLYLLKSVG